MRAFAPGRLSRRDYANKVVADVGHRQDTSVCVYTEGQIPFFHRMLIKQRDRPVVIKNDDRIYKFDAVLAQVALGLLRIPFKI